MLYQENDCCLSKHSCFTIPLKLVASSDTPDSNLFSPTDNIWLEGKALFRDFQVDYKEKPG